MVDPESPKPFPAELSEGIGFDQVTFNYPGASRPALKQFNVNIPAGQFAAIVGPNGAGKSTLIRLLCRFYDPQAGAITLDGENIKDFSLQDLRRSITVLFQEPVQYNTTASENIALGDWRRGQARNKSKSQRRRLGRTNRSGDCRKVTTPYWANGSKAAPT